MKPVIGIPRAELYEAWDKILDSGQFVDGVYTRLFEESVEVLYEQHAAAFNGAGPALTALVHHFVQKGVSRWLVPGNTFYATASSVISAGGQVYVGDCDPESFCLSMSELVDHPKFQGIVLTHVGGPLYSQYQEIAGWCEEHKIVLIEDAAHAFGVVDELGWRAGQLSKGAVFSFYPTKAVPIGDGGMVVSKDDGLIEWLKSYRNYAKKPRTLRVEHRVDMVGENFRISEWAAAVGYLQVNRLPEILEKRHEDAEVLKRYCEPLIDRSDHTNWYKYIVPSAFPAKHLAGAVYRAEDQIQTVLQGYVLAPEKLLGCKKIAESHVCLPIGEGQYVGKSSDHIVKELGLV